MPTMREMNSAGVDVFALRRAEAPIQMEYGDAMSQVADALRANIRMLHALLDAAQTKIVALEAEVEMLRKNADTAKAAYDADLLRKAEMIADLAERLATLQAKDTGRPAPVLWDRPATIVKGDALEGVELADMVKAGPSGIGLVQRRPGMEAVCYIDTGGPVTLSNVPEGAKVTIGGLEALLDAPDRPPSGRRTFVQEIKRLRRHDFNVDGICSRCGSDERTVFENASITRDLLNCPK